MHQISKTNFFLGGIIVGAILIYMNFFSLIEGLGTLDYLYWPFFLVFLVILVLYIDSLSFRFVQRNFPFISGYAVVVGLSLLVVVIGTMTTYRQSLTRTLREVMPYTMFLLAIPMLMYIIRKGTTNGLFSIINTISLIWFFLIIIQRYVYSKNGIIIFSSDFEYQVRDGIRISLSCVGNLSIILNLYQLLYVEKKNRCKFVKIVLSLGIYSLLVIQQTRALTFAISACFLTMIIMERRKEPKYRIRKWGFITLVLVVLFSTEIYNTFLDSFSQTGEYAHSTNVRIDAIDYYLSIVKNNPLFGFGFVGVADYERLIRGPYDSYFLNDVGIFGQMARLGVFIIPIYIWIVFRFIRITIETLRIRQNREFVLLLSLCVYVVITSFSVIILDTARAIAIPILISVFEYQHYKNKKLV